MKKTVEAIIIMLSVFLSIPGMAAAKDTPYTVEDRDRLIRVEAKAEYLEKEMKQIHEDMKQIREDMNSQFNRLSAIFTALVVAMIGFAIWDRRTMIRPFEDKVKKIEDDISRDRTMLHSLLESLRTLSKKDSELAEILKRFNLL